MDTDHRKLDSWCNLGLPPTLLYDFLDFKWFDLWEDIGQSLGRHNVEHSLLEPQAKNGQHALQGFLREEWINWDLARELGDLPTLKLVDTVIRNFKFSPCLSVSQETLLARFIVRGRIYLLHLPQVEEIRSMLAYPR